ncbi:MAG: hypothetical protein H7319_18410 [Spirosoma sp.]|nr:hypothetical protein [Spirosoma sp.]
MRISGFLFIALLIWQSGVAQNRRAKTVTYSAASAWTNVTLQAPARPLPPATRSSPARSAATTPAEGYRPAFTGDFVTNRNGWQAGSIGNYQYQIGTGVYNVRKRNPDTKQTAFSFVPLPAQINLNLADYFTIKADVVSESGRPPVGGITFGVSDSLTYTAFQLDHSGQVSIRRLDNGRIFSDYMPGDYFNPNVVVNNNRNQLIIRRKRDFLHFYINEDEIRTSPYPFKMLGGNGIGFVTNGDWTSFQKLSVTLDAPVSVGTTQIIPSPAPARVVVTPPVQAAQPKKPAVANEQLMAVKPQKETSTPMPDASGAVASTPVTTKPSAPAGGSLRAGWPSEKFTDTFTRNEHGWLTGKRKGYEFEIINDSYYIRRLSGAAQESGRCYIDLPATLNLNTAQSFTISVEMTTAPGQTPQGGLLLGVQNVDNLVQFALADQQQVVVRSLNAGRSQADYMSGKRTPAGVPINPDRNKLTVTKQADKLFFYLNGQEIAGSPYEFKPFKGNGIGFIAGETDIKLQNLVVQVE